MDKGRMRRGDRVAVVLGDGTVVRETVTEARGNDVRFESGATADLASMSYTPRTGAPSQVERFEN